MVAVCQVFVIVHNTYIYKEKLSARKQNKLLLICASEVLGGGCD